MTIVIIKAVKTYHYSVIHTAQQYINIIFV